MKAFAEMPLYSHLLGDANRAAADAAEWVLLASAAHVAHIGVPSKTREVASEGFEPPNAEQSDLQSDPFGRLGNSPGAGALDQGT